MNYLEEHNKSGIKAGDKEEPKTTTDKSQQDLIEEMGELIECLSNLERDLKSVEKADRLLVVDNLGTNGSLYLSFNKSALPPLKEVVKGLLENQKTEHLCRISKIVGDLLK